MVRFAAPVHKHIEFDLELRQIFFSDNGQMRSKKLILSGARGVEDQILAQLDVGTYYLKLLFYSDSFFIN